MSIAAMNWAWLLLLRPSVKLVLMALADAADDHGYCWPSVQTIARKTNLDVRSVQRILSSLQKTGLLIVEHRYRKDGSQSTNRYRLALEIRGDKMPPITPVQSQAGVAFAPLSGDIDATQTTSESSMESKPPQPPDGAGRDLIYPRQLSVREVVLASQRLNGLSSELAQEVLDEVAARMNAGSVRGSPLAYLRSLVNRAREGTFTPEAGVRVAQNREREKAIAEHAKRQASSNISQNTISPQEQLVKLYEAMGRKPKIRQESQNE